MRWAPSYLAAEQFDSMFTARLDLDLDHRHCIASRVFQQPAIITLNLMKYFSHQLDGSELFMMPGLASVYPSTWWFYQKYFKRIVQNIFVKILVAMTGEIKYCGFALHWVYFVWPMLSLSLLLHYLQIFAVIRLTSTFDGWPISRFMALVEVKGFSHCCVCWLWWWWVWK